MLLLMLLACGGSPTTPERPPAQVEPDEKVAVSVQVPHELPELGGVPAVRFALKGAGADSPAFVGLHGRGSDPVHFAVWFQHLQGQARFLFPQGPKTAGESHGWLDTPINGPAPNLDREIRAAADTMAAWLAEHHPEPATLVGWSQGGMVAAALALHHPDRVVEAWVGGVRLPVELFAGADPATAKPLHVFGGDADTVTPMVDARAAVNAAVERGLTATFTAVPGGDHRFHIAPLVPRFADRGLGAPVEPGPGNDAPGPDGEPWDGTTMKPGPDGEPVTP
jgi:predicted esterase